MHGRIVAKGYLGKMFVPVSVTVDYALSQLSNLRTYAIYRDMAMFTDVADTK